MLIGQTKFKDIPLMPVDVMKSATKDIAQHIDDGTPPDLPMQLPMGQFAQLMRTIEEYISVLEEFKVAENLTEEQLASIDKLLSAAPPPPPSLVQLAR